MFPAEFSGGIEAFHDFIGRKLRYSLNLPSAHVKLLVMWKCPLMSKQMEKYPM